MQKLHASQTDHARLVRFVDYLFANYAALARRSKARGELLSIAGPHVQRLLSQNRELRRQLNWYQGEKVRLEQQEAELAPAGKPQIVFVKRGPRRLFEHYVTYPRFVNTTQTATQQPPPADEDDLTCRRQCPVHCVDHEDCSSEADWEDLDLEEDEGFDSSGDEFNDSTARGNSAELESQALAEVSSLKDAASDPKDSELSVDQAALATSQAETDALRKQLKKAQEEVLRMAVANRALTDDCANKETECSYLKKELDEAKAKEKKDECCCSKHCPKDQCVNDGDTSSSKSKDAADDDAWKVAEQQKKVEDDAAIKKEAEREAAEKIVGQDAVGKRAADEAAEKKTAEHAGPSNASNRMNDIGATPQNSSPHEPAFKRPEMYNNDPEPEAPKPASKAQMNVRKIKPLKSARHAANKRAALVKTSNSNASTGHVTSPSVPAVLSNPPILGLNLLDRQPTIERVRDGSVPSNTPITGFSGVGSNFNSSTAAPRSALAQNLDFVLNGGAPPVTNNTPTTHSSFPQSAVNPDIDNGVIGIGIPGLSLFDGGAGTAPSNNDGLADAMHIDLPSVGLSIAPISFADATAHGMGNMLLNADRLNAPNAEHREIIMTEDNDYDEAAQSTSAAEGSQLQPNGMLNASDVDFQDAIMTGPFKAGGGNFDETGMPFNYFEDNEQLY